MRLIHLASKTRRIFTSLLLGFAAVSAGATDPVQKVTGVVLPGEVEGFVRSAVLGPEQSPQGQRSGVRYDQGEDYRATVFVYSAKARPPITSLDDPRMAVMRADLVQSVLAGAQAQGPLSRHTGGTSGPSRSASDPTPVFIDTFIVYPEGRATNRMLYIWLAGGHVWTIDITRSVNYHGPQQITRFARAVVGLTGG